MTKSSKSQPNSASVSKRSWFHRILHWIRIAFLIFTASSAAVVLLYRFVPPPATPLMLLRLCGQGLSGRPFRLEKTWKPLKEISPYLPASVLISEDQDFFEHHGFDFNAIQGALKRNETRPSTSSGRRHLIGASTISQQTAKNVFLWPDRSWLRKGLEVYFTVWIELLWSKRRILEVYLNVIEMGDGVYGAEAASERYFHCTAKSLDAEQSALIAATLPNPRAWAPPHPPRRVFRRQAWILRQMPEFIGRPELK